MVNSASQRFASIGAMICALLCSVALAREPTLGLDEYAHRAWKFGDGFAVAPPIVSLAQTPDGYLWLGSHTGLWRFDGVKAVPWRAPEGRHLPDNWIGSLAVTHDGTLWISTTGGLVSWRDGKLTEYPALAGQEVMALLVDREGTVWAGTESRATSTGRLCAIRDSVVRCYGEDGSLGQRIYCLYEDDAGHLWFASSSGVWLWRSDKPKLLYPLHDPVWGYFQNLTSGPDGALLVSAYDGVREIVGGEVRALPLPGVLPQAQPPRVLTDRQGGLWLGTIDSGLRYVHAGSMESYAKSDGLSGDHISRMFEDREGNIWVATVNGLDEFWKVAVARFSGEPSLSRGRVSAVLADVDGSIWFATPTGLYRRKDGEMTVYRGPARRGDMPARGIAQTAVREIIATGLPRDTSGSLYQDHRGRIWLGSPAGLGYLQNDRFVPVPGVPGGNVNSITEDDRGNLWVAHRKLGLLRISPDGKSKAFGWAELGIGETWRIAFDPARGGLWLGSVLGEIAFFADGQIRASYAGDAPGKRAVHDLRLDPDGTLWAATEGGLIRLRNGHLTTLSSKDGLPCDIVHATIDDGAGSYWLYTACGIVRVARSDLDAWSDSGTQGSLSQGAIRTLLLDASDGVVNTIGEGSFSPNVAKSSDGRLWFATPDGAMTVDPRNLPRNSLPPPVHIEQITADRKSYEASPNLRLPPLTRDLEIDYTALSLVAPGKNQYRYRIEGRDRDWQDAGNRRQAFYSDLDPGNYRFRVIASNNSGVWNEEGASLDFSIAPAYWQTNWFRALCVAAFIALLWGLYLLRLRQVKRQFNMITTERRRAEAERMKLEERLHQAEKMEAIGRFASGIAHDFNNVIGGIMAYGEMLFEEAPEDAPRKRYAQNVLAAATRGHELVEQILVYSRRQRGERVPTDICRAVAEALELFRASVPAFVTLKTSIPDAPLVVMGNATQFYQVVTNLCSNAIQAMSAGGALQVAITPVEVVAERPLSCGKLRRGRFACLSVEDSGSGMDEATLVHIFEPFFTTKEAGRGTGLGLALVYAIVTDLGGAIDVKSVPGEGSTFSIYLPLADVTTAVVAAA